MRLFLMLIMIVKLSFAQVDIYDSGGPLMPEQAAYDVTFYDLNLQVMPQDSSIDGYVAIVARIVQPIDYFVVDLDTLLSISKISEVKDGKEIKRSFERKIGKIWIAMQNTRQPGQSVEFKVYYNGKPRVAIRPPWDGGLTWAKTKDGSPWIATSCQGEGADIWWPLKDHVSDEPDSMGIHIRVADPLICATNGKLLSVEKHNDKTSTYHWFVSTPINNYTVALNIAPYKVIERDYKSTTGEIFPFKFWVLPEDYEKGVKITPEFMDHLRFFEETLGPYPFRADKYGVAQTPHLGMEHQTIIAYGANFSNSSMTGGIDWGFDALHHHELAHEWWGNLVTNTDWKDLWIHEGFGTYMQALYAEKLEGMAGYHKYIANMRNFGEDMEVAPRETTSGSGMNGRPVYSKGATVLHALRYLIGEEALRKSLRRMAYPDPQMEKVTDGSQTRFVTTNDFVEIAEKVSGKELDWFFDLYIHQPLLPELDAKLVADKLSLSWKTPNGLPFPMPIDVKNGNKVIRVEINENGGTLQVNPDKEIIINPERWVLFKATGINEAQTLVQKGEYGKAEQLYKKAIFIDPSDNASKKMLKHIKYAMGTTSEKIEKVYQAYVGRYRLNANRDYRITREGNSFFVERRRVKYRMFPLSDTKFMVAEFDADYEIQHDEQGNIKSLEFDFFGRHFSAKFIDDVVDQTL